MRDPMDVMSYGVGLTTAGVGVAGVTAGDVQLILSLLASGLGIVLTAMTLWWRRAEHKRRVEEFKREQKRLEEENGRAE